MMAIATRSRPGGSTNQDRMAYCEGPGGTFIIVADGAGGAGGEAAAAAVALVEFARSEAATQVLTAATCEQLLRDADRVVAKNNEAGFCTAIIAVVNDGCVFGASVGDSEAWMVLGEQFYDLTRAQVRKPLLGSGEATPIAFGSLPLNGTLILGTDGLFKYARRSAILLGVANEDIEHAADELVKAAKLPSGGFQDDITVALYREADSSRPTPPPKSKSSRCRILLVENHEVFAKIVVAQFLAGHQVVHVMSISDAKRQLTQANFDVVLVDYDLDDGKGVEVVRAAKHVRHPPQVIAMSAHDAGNNALVCAGADAVCRKTAFQEISALLEKVGDQVGDSDDSE